jgi:hypothetical protein
MPLETSRRLRELVEASNPLNTLWGFIVDTARRAAKVCASARFFEEIEKGLYELERMIFECYFDLYERIAQGCRNQKTLEWVTASPADVILFSDGFSIREAALLENFLAGTESRGRTVHAQIIGFRYSGLPSDTATCKASLWPQGAYDRSTEEFDFYQLNPGQRLAGASFTRRTVIWYPLPDHGLHQTEPRYGTTPQDVFDRLRQDVERLLEDVPSGTVWITGDHGYVYVPSTKYYWEMKGELQRPLSRLFGDRRSGDPEALDETTRQMADCWRWYRSLMLVDDVPVLLGRYWRPKKGAADACHGGLSLPECMVPVLELHIERCVEARAK